MQSQMKTPSFGGSQAQYDSIIEVSRAHHSIDSAAERLVAEMYEGVSLRGSGRWKRFYPPGKRELDGYVGILSHEAAVIGWWGREHHLIVLGDDDMDDQQRHEKRERARQEAERAKRERRVELERTWDKRAALAQSEVHAPLANPEHRYLRAKHIPPCGLRQAGVRLIAPMTDGKVICNVQSIFPNGDKRFMAGAKKKGCYHAIGSLKTGEPLLICEGVATGITLHMATGYAVACAMDCGNLLPVARSLRARHPATPIIVCADNDHRTPGNPGVTAGKAAAAAVGGRCIWPEFPEGSEATDYNDLAVNGGEVSL